MKKLEIDEIKKEFQEETAKVVATANKILHTEMLNKYTFNLILRVVIFIAVFILYLTNKELMGQFIKFDILRTQNLPYVVSPIHILWLYLMIVMLTHIFPSKKNSMAMNKATSVGFQEIKDYNRLGLLEYVQQQNARVWIVMLIWLSFNAVFGALYLFKVIDEIDLVMLSVFYFLSDYICILLYCPFQTHIMKNKCCVNCRIYDWGHFMMFTPMLFIKDFFSWSLFFTSLVVLIRWEIYYAKYPERFWEGSNENLKCANCDEKLCQFKKRLKR